MSKILFWSGFGLAVRLWQLGIEMRPLFNKQSLWAYPVFAAVGGSFGYWLTGVEMQQTQLLQERKASLLDKRRRRAEKEARITDGAIGAPIGGGDGHGHGQTHNDGGWYLGKN